MLEQYKQTHKDEEKCEKRKNYYRNHILQIKKYHENYNKLKSLRLNIFKKNLFVDNITEPKMNPEDTTITSNIVQMKPKRVRKPKVVAIAVEQPAIIEPVVNDLLLQDMDEPDPIVSPKQKAKKTVTQTEDEKPIIEQPKPKSERTEKQKAAFENMVKAKREKKEQMKQELVAHVSPDGGCLKHIETTKKPEPVVIEPVVEPCVVKKSPKPRKPRQPRKKMIYVDNQDQENYKETINNEHGYNYLSETKPLINTQENNNKIIFC